MQLKSEKAPSTPAGLFLYNSGINQFKTTHCELLSIAIDKGKKSIYK